MRPSRMTGVIALAAVLSACGGGSGGGGTPTSSVTPSPSPTPAPTPTPTPTSTACSLSARQDWALGEMESWYLFDTLLNTGVNKAAHSTLQSYIDALVAQARAQNKDKHFTYVTSIAEEEAYYSSGSTAGFGVRLTLDASNRLFIMEAFESGPAYAQGIDRGTEILEIGDSASTKKSVSSIMASGGSAALNAALGPSEEGVTVYFTIDNGAGPVSVVVTKADYSLDPVSSRYGYKVLDDGGKKVGYINLRTFISTANAPLSTAFATFKSQGINEFIIDFRYNGGGLVSVAEHIGDLLGGSWDNEVFSHTTFNSSKSVYNSTYRFNPDSNSVSPTKIAFIGTGNTASASELVANAMKPYVGTNLALVGGNTYGKPVGQVARDLAPCDDRLRVVAFKTVNADNEGEYFSGLAGVMPNTCAATDDLSAQLGSKDEDMIATALDFLGGRSCTPISSSGLKPQALKERYRALQPELDEMTAAQHEVPGLY
ncbi:S41 family peptidase [Sphingomicrobium nitratireducens]|uniref:S41 family peptidase n=1 Tax=Sphingomicrobium nitratireducens TaxID=2964666 RepID=UPI00223EE6B4|nr:S41 family peptidase [Sphingomicrobium nitratireducens]